MTKDKMQRYSISVSGATYDRLRAAVDGRMATFVDDVVRSALDDPAIRARLLTLCPQKPSKKVAREPLP